MTGRAGRAPRALAIGVDFRDERIPCISLRSTHTCLGRELIVLRLDDVVYGYNTESWNPTYNGQLNLDTDSSFQIRADFDRRRGELQTVLEMGGTVVLFLPPPAKWWIATGKVQHSGTGRNRQTTRTVDEMGLFSLLPFPLSCTPATTDTFELTAGEPFATFWRKNADRFEAAAVLSKPFGDPMVVIKGTNQAVAAIGRIAKGLVVILPQELMYPEEYLLRREGEEADDSDNAPDVAAYEGDVTLIDSLFYLVTELQGSSDGFVLPQWAAEFVLPGENQLSDALRSAQETARQAQAEVDSLHRQLSLLERRKALFTASGRSLETLVEEAFAALGFEVVEGRPGRTDRVVRHQDQAAVVEIKGRAKSAAEKDCAQLEKWVSDYHVEHGHAAKPILVVNAWRDTRLDERAEEAFPDQMIPFATARQHCLITGIQLLCAWLDAEAHPERRGKIASAMMRCIGRYEGYRDWGTSMVKELSSQADTSEQAANGE